MLFHKNFQHFRCIFRNTQMIFPILKTVLLIYIFIPIYLYIYPPLYIFRFDFFGISCVLYSSIGNSNADKRNFERLEVRWWRRFVNDNYALCIWVNEYMYECLHTWVKLMWVLTARRVRTIGHTKALGLERASYSVDNSI